MGRRENATWIPAGDQECWRSSIHAFDAATGKEVWKHAVGRGVNGPIAGGSGRAYAASREGQLLSLDVGSGALIRSHSIDYTLCSRVCFALRRPGASFVHEGHQLGTCHVRLLRARRSFDLECAAYLFGCGTLGRCAVADARAFLSPSAVPAGA